MSNKKHVVYVQYTNPCAYPPLEHSSRILASRGWQVTFLGTGSWGGKDLRFTNENNVTLHMMNYCKPGWVQKLHYVRFWLWCFMRCVVSRPHIVYASDAWSYPIGWSLSFIPGIKVAMHEHDTPSMVNTRVNRLIRWFRRKLAQRAIICICPQENRAARIKLEIKPKRTQVVFNCPPLLEHLNVTSKVDVALRLWFHGSIVPTQLPLQIIDAMAQCEFPIQLQFCGYETIGHPGYVQELLDRAKTLAIGNRVEYLGSIPTRKEMFAAASKCHVGLTLFAMQFREPMVGASNKPFDYLACGLTLLVPDTDEWRIFFVDAGCAIACDSEHVESIANSLRWCWENHDAFADLNRRGRELLSERWNYEIQFQPVVEVFEQSTNRP